jgi:hypothetical protein
VTGNVTGNTTGIVNTDRIIPTGGVPSGGAGGVIQVKQKVITGTYAESVPPGNSGPYGNLVDSETITPTRSDSKILIMMNLNVGASHDGNISATLHRNGSVISGAIGADPGSRTPVTATEFTSSSSRQVQMNITYLDSPASTSTQTYGFKFSTAENGSINVYLNRDNNFGTSYHTQKPISTITLIELSG